MKREDLTGQRFGKLTAIKYIGNSKWECHCDCGNTVFVKADNLKSENSKSCWKCKRELSDYSRMKMSESAKRRGMAESVRQKGRDVKSHTLGGGRFETNRNAKQWHLISPDGQEYHISNLLLFVREHAEMFGIDGKDDKKCKYILQQFSVLKWHMKNDGKQTTCCGGWKIIIPEDDRINKYK